MSLNATFDVEILTSTWIIGLQFGLIIHLLLLSQNKKQNLQKKFTPKLTIDIVVPVSLQNCTLGGVFVPFCVLQDAQVIKESCWEIFKINLAHINWLNWLTKVCDFENLVKI